MTRERLTEAMLENRFRSTKEETLRLNFLDGVRALAALFVVMHHVRISTLGGDWFTARRAALLNVLQYGHLAVDVFIVLSGFCLVLPVARHGTLKGGAINFFKRRAWRILPPFLASLVMSYAVQFYWHSIPVDQHHPPIQMLLVNLFLLQDLFPRYNIVNVPLWSVAVEWKIYFLFPFFAWLWLRPYGRRAAAPAVVLTVTALVGYSLTAVLHRLLPNGVLAETCPWYVFLFGMGLCAGASSVREGGSAVVEWWKDRWILAWIVGLIAACILLKTYYPLSYDAMPILDPAIGALTALTLFLLTRGQIQGRRSLAVTILSWRPLVFIGTFAYSIYLIHVCILQSVTELMVRLHLWSFPLAYSAFSAVLVSVVIIVIGTAYVFFLAFERPFLVRRRRETLAEVARDAVRSPAP